MAKLIGVVSKIVGEVFAVAGDGSRRALTEGDRLFAGEQLQTGAAGAVAVHLQNGHELTLGRDSSLSLSPQLLASQAPQVNTPDSVTPTEAMLTDVQQLQKAIAAGADPTQTGEATAAGPTGTNASGALGGGHSFVLLTEVAGRVEPVIGFPTAGFGGIPEFALFQVAGEPDTGNDTPVVAPPPVLPPDNPVTLSGLTVEGGEVTVNEANLALGSASNPAALVQTGTFSVSALDGLQSLTVGGISVVSGGVASGFPQSITTGLGNTLSITGYNATTGVISYSYTLTGNEAHSAGGGTNSLGEQFSVVATDSDGDSATGSLDVTVIDDVPRAINDTPEGSASESQLILTGNVLGNDVQGADRVASGPIVGGTFAGQYGTLVLQADGSYIYTLNTGDADFIALHGGGNGTETFAYTLTDADGDTSTANLVLQVHNNDDPVVIGGINVNGADMTLYEKNLTDGSSPDATALTRTGNLTVSAVDGLQSLNVGGINVVAGGVSAGFPQSIVTGLGNTLTITGYNAATGVVTYSYTLTGNEAHSAGGGTNSLAESFSVVATDTNDSSATGALHISVVDDVPQAVDDSNLSTASESLQTLSGTVLGNDVQGADRVATGPITAGTFAGTYGSLVLAADGTYTYTLNTADADFIALHGGGNGTETFAYTLTDADGDTSTANLVLQVHNNNDPVVLTGLEVNGGELTVYEKNLPLGSATDTPALTQSGTFTVTALDGLQTLTVGGISVVSGGVAAGFPQSIPTGYGNTLTITGYNATTGVISYSYTLNGTDSHPTGAGANSISESFVVTAADSDTNTATGSLDVTIVDDVPKAVDDSNLNTASESLQTLSGTVLGNDVQGADRVATGPITAGTFAGTYGSLVLAADGTYTYTLNTADADFIALHGGGNGTETFAYTLTDADGDTSTANLVLQVHNNNDPVVLTGLEVNGGELTVYEKNLPLGSATDTPALTQSGTFTVTALDGLQTLTVGGISVVSGGVAAGFPQSIPTGYGNTLTITGYNATTGVISYSYTLNGTDSHPTGAGANSISESFVVTAADSDTNTATGTLDVNIVDDVPKVVASERSVTATEVDSNLLLIIDVSGSMNDASGAGGTRLSLAKAAINELLTKYDEMGDVKVQIVTFSTGSTQLTSQWVDVATAKSIVAGISATGGTNYDSALGTAQTAFTSGGKLTGAQNLSYFFSDGNPTLSNTNNPNNPGDQVNPEFGDGINASEEVLWKAFLDANGIKSYAIGLGAGVNGIYLDPVAYDGSTHTNTNSVVVTNLAGLDAVLAGTVQGAPVTGSLMTAGTFGADGGFIKSLMVDGITYTYDPAGLGNQGSMSANLPGGHGTFDTLSNSITITTSQGGTLVVDMDSGEFRYTPPKLTDTAITENFGVVVSDNDGDLVNSSLVVKVNPNATPVAGDDHVITNIFSSTIVVPGELLLLNDSDPNYDRLTATPTSFTTGWALKGADFTGTGSKAFAVNNNVPANQILPDVRSSFAGNTATLIATLAISGYLGNVTTANANDEDRITVSLKQGETLNLDHNVAGGRITMEYSLNGGGYIPIADGGTITAAADGVYQIHITNITNTSGSNVDGSQNYLLTMKLNYAGAQDFSPDFHGNYTVNDSHGGSDSGAVSISYQSGNTLNGTAGDDILMAGPGNNILNGGDGNDVLTAGTGNNQLHGGNGTDLLFSGVGNDLLDGGAGIDTASYAHATGGVTVDLGLLVAQNTFGAGTDTLMAVENLIGSNFNDTLIGNGSNNLLSGGLGNDTLSGGGGDDILIGGPGNNTLTGGTGADTFQYAIGNTGHDVITDFVLGIDKLDLSQLLQGENATTASLDDYLHFKVVGGMTTLDISAVAGAAPSQTIDLAGVNLATHYGVTPGAGGVIAGGADTATIINGMLNDHSLKVDTV
ncbi:retention module-containing protein [Pseudomonas sp. ANT_H4]|uniref:retention module-containing protein n=1 Tax=Pseudomonas sp. ANT_H4 TaxID=2597350 RepID=UPI0011F1FEE1|nr:retention module-containing protein [Pseudomonas sp. ANT_H4]KAA0948309.1 retention module-containing protein [Pseudomonas sp. ANT_H4]